MEMVRKASVVAGMLGWLAVMLTAAFCGAGARACTTCPSGWQVGGSPTASDSPQFSNPCSGNPYNARVDVSITTWDYDYCPDYGGWYWDDGVSGLRWTFYTDYSCMHGSDNGGGSCTMWADCGTQPYKIIYGYLYGNDNGNLYNDGGEVLLGSNWFDIH